MYTYSYIIIDAHGIQIVIFIFYGPIFSFRPFNAMLFALRWLQRNCAFQATIGILPWGAQFLWSRENLSTQGTHSGNSM